LYDALLEDFEDDVTRANDDEETFGKLPTSTLDDDDETHSDDGDEIQAKPDDDDELLISSPVRMYLTQMGEIPLLTRQQEIYLAKKIEVTRRRFRTKLLECDYVIQTAFKVLNRVHEGELPFDRTVQVSVTDRLEKDQILGRLPHNLKTLNVLLKRNRRDYLVSLSKSQGKLNRRLAWQRLARRRRRSVRLIEELGLRTQRIETMIVTLDQFSRRVDELKRLIDNHRQARGPIAAPR
jgi:RNA polymerase primary sigma factor